MISLRNRTSLIVLIATVLKLGISMRRKDSSIPKVIHKVFIDHSMKLDLNSLDNHTKEAHESWRRLNPDYTVKYYSGEDCRKYLKEHFGDRHLIAFDALKPYSGKVNFFRYCVLYREGGIYSDWKQVCLEPIDNFVHPELNWFSNWDLEEHLMMNAFFGSCPRHPVLQNAIDMCFEHILRKEYGRTPLWTTACYVLYSAYRKHNPSIPWGKKLYTSNQMVDAVVVEEGSYYFKFWNKYVVLHKHKKLTQDQNWSNGNNYVSMWNNRDVYNDVFVRKLKTISKINTDPKIAMLVMNLRRDTNRLSNFLKYYENMTHKIPLHVVDAVDGASMMNTKHFKDWDEIMRKNGYFHPSHTSKTHQSYKGVQMSLVKSLKLAKKLRLNWVVVCEDDAEPDKNLNFKDVLDLYPDSKVIYMDDRNPGGDGYVPMACINCAIYHSSIFDALIKELDPLTSKYYRDYPKQTPNIYDWYIHWLITQKLKVKGSSHPVVGGHKFDSTLTLNKP